MSELQPASFTTGPTWEAGPGASAATARAVIDLDAVTHNARVLAGVAGTPWMAIVKADAYGHGLLPIARACLEAGATWLGVAQLDEALHLRMLLDAQGVARPEPQRGSLPTSGAPRILCWLAPVLSARDAARSDSPLRAALAADLDLSASTPAQIKAIQAAAGAQGVRARVHIKIDTGMSRAGATPDDFPALVQAAKSAQDAGDLEIVALWSHLSRADEPTCGSTEAHLDLFRRAERILADAGVTPRIRHLAATGGLLWHPDTRLDLVRCGIGLYGLSPDPQVATSQELGLRPVMRLEAPVMQVKRVAAGQAVSYGGTWSASTERWLGLVPLGYGDGIPRAAASTGPVWVNGLRTHVVGRVCMDQFVIDLGPAIADDAKPLPAPARPGDMAVLWGDPAYLPGRSGSDEAYGEGTGLAEYAAGEGKRSCCAAPSSDAPVFGAIPTADEWAQVCGTINYEMVTRLGPRVPRTYVHEG